MSRTTTTLDQQTGLYTVALMGNPNSGKTSIFNYLTGLRQKTANFPGVTVDKKSGKFSLGDGTDVSLLDLPGAYSLHPTSEDERIVNRLLCDPFEADRPDAILYVANTTLLEKHLLLFTQIRDMGIPSVLLLNMSDLAEKRGVTFELEKLEKKLNCPVLAVSGRTRENLERIRETLQDLMADQKEKATADRPFYNLPQAEDIISKKVQEHFVLQHKLKLTPYHALLLAHHGGPYGLIPHQLQEDLDQLSEKLQFNKLHSQVKETMKRYDRFVPIVESAIKREATEARNSTDRIDRIVMHRIWGPVIFFGIMLLVFQAIYAWSTYPMDLIEAMFGFAGQGVRQLFPESWIGSLLSDGVLAGLGGILVFVPQIAILFFLISLLEEVGYMARAVYMFDKIMQRFGLNGRSIVALISGGACAIPAIMSTRTIANKKERLITIFVTPFISCSARIPVYTVLIGFVVPAAAAWGIFNLQGIAFMGLYLLGIIAALGSAWVFHKILKTDEISYLAIELPDYKYPDWRTVGLTVWEKVRTFIWEAGKIIFFISIILWVLASYGPAGEMEQAREEARITAVERGLDEQATEDLIAAKELQNSFAAKIGKSIEPVIEPLGFDWKIGIALITSFAAREVFVGTMATLYSVGSEEDEFRIRDKLAAEVDPDTGRPVYTLATSVSLLLFYVFALQCMSTLAVVRRETKSWKWPVVQFFYMGGVAYLSSLLAYQLLS